ncbi:hypothetical protein Nekkels1_21 [Cellulophaga phage Nekkels_1]|uniref:Uncharacterized protein n=1 Tax=Cellulophaga phage Nekkels_1 TaxID=2745692 RepID=A0A8E4UXF1_9CAUD|nr:hypothetical protein M1M31_gp21 [Cellulophaga phage Nekkels_1]QQO97021.1 hypothetical protein Nekkels1_21 [Cellulophaga phage Nekkels_1]QQO97114.1 hypothetical protein Nekkels2_21 [Cellulophaga phage Nekkels_2]
MIKIYKYLFGDWNKWRDVSCSENLGWISIIQTRTEKRTGKRQVRVNKTWVNDSARIGEITKNMLKD